VAVAKATKPTDVEAFTAQTAIVWENMNNQLLSPHAALVPSPKAPLFMQPLLLSLIDTLLQKNWFIVAVIALLAALPPLPKPCCFYTISHHHLTEVTSSLMSLQYE